MLRSSCALERSFQGFALSSTQRALTLDKEGPISSSTSDSPSAMRQTSLVSLRLHGRDLRVREDFLESGRGATHRMPDHDMQMPGLNGIDLQST